MEKKNIIIIAVISVLLFVIGFATATFFLNKNSAGDQKQNEIDDSRESITKLEEEQVENGNDNGSHKRYYNEEGGFGFEYPEGWTLETDLTEFRLHHRDEKPLTGTGVSLMKDGPPPMSYYMVVFRSYETLTPENIIEAEQTKNGFSFKSQKDISLTGLEAIELTFTTDHGSPVIYILTDHDNDQLVIKRSYSGITHFEEGEKLFFSSFELF